MKLNIRLYLYFFIGIVLFSCENSNTAEVHELPENSSNQELQRKLDSVNELLDSSQMKDAAALNNQLIRLANSHENVYFLGKGYGISGYIKIIQNEDDSAFYYLNLSKENFLKLNDSVNISKCLTNMAIIQSNQADYSGSELSSTEALKYITDEENTNFLSSIYNCLAISSHAKKNDEEAIYWYRKALNSASAAYDQKLYANNLGVSYSYLKNYEKSDSILSNLLIDSTVIQNNYLKSKVLDNLTYVKWKQNPNLDVENDFKKALRIREENKDDWGLIASHSHLSEYFYEKEPQKALLHAQQMYETATQLRSPDDRLEALQKLIELETHENAKRYAVAYTQLSDSFQTSRNRTKDQFAKIRFDSEKNREENQMLKIETAEQDLEIERRKLYAILLVSALVLFGMATLAYFRIQKLKNHKKLTEEIYATEQEMASKVHDEVSNNVYRLMSEIDNQKDFISAERKENIVSKLDEIYKLSRNISRESSPIETGKNFPDELRNLISSYKNEQTNIMLMGFDEIHWEKFQFEKKIQFYRILQELLTNMKKHSGASLVVLSFKLEKNNFHFFYSDNGLGSADFQSIAKNGIRITENRIEKIKGKISFASEPDKGLKVKISIPL